MGVGVWWEDDSHSPGRPEKAWLPPQIPSARVQADQAPQPLAHSLPSAWMAWFGEVARITRKPQVSKAGSWGEDLPAREASLCPIVGSGRSHDLPGIAGPSLPSAYSAPSGHIGMVAPLASGLEVHS